MRSEAFGEESIGSNGQPEVYVFENLTDEQAEKVLRSHGSNGVFLVTMNTENQHCYVYLLLSHDEGGEGKCVRYHLQQVKNGFLMHLQDTSVAGNTITEAVDGLCHYFASKGLPLQPVFGNLDSGAAEKSLSFSVISPPPEYSAGQRYPDAPRKKLPTIKDIHSSLMQTIATNSTSYGSITSTTVKRNEPGCFHRLCHCDPAGHWWKPHKAGPCMAVLLVIGWILFLLFFGWAVAIFMLFGLLLLGIMYLVNFICTCSCTDPFN
jgi:hypothetical protein